MYEVQFQATDDADWGQAYEIIDASTNLPMDVSDCSFELEVKDHHCAVLTASTDDNTITRPDANTIQWVFTKDQMCGLRQCRTFRVGLRMTNASGTIPVFVGSLAIIDGGFD